MKRFQSLLVYLSAFLANMGNYTEFGNSKFIPDLPKGKLEALVVNSKAFKTNGQEFQWIWDQIKDKIYSLEKNELTLGFAPNVLYFHLSYNLFNVLYCVSNLRERQLFSRRTAPKRTQNSSQNSLNQM